MTALSVCLAFLCVGLFLTEPVSGALTKLLNATKEDLQHSRFRLTAHFEADSKPQAQWWWYSFYDLLDPPTDSVVTYGSDPSNPQKGTVTATVTKAGIGDLFLSLGDLDSHYLRIMWNVTGSGNLSAQLNYPLATVQPCTDLAYSKGEVSNLTVAVKEDIDAADGVEVLRDFQLSLSGVYSYQNNFITGKGGPPVKKESHESKNGVTTTSVTFRTDQFAINGVFDGELHRLRSPTVMVMEHVTVKVHEAGTVGPFPDGAVLAEADGFRNCRRSGTACFVQCKGYGNDLASVKLYKENSKGRRRIVRAETHGHGQAGFYKMIQVNVKTATLPAKATFVCEVTLRGGQKAEDKHVANIRG